MDPLFLVASRLTKYRLSASDEALILPFLQGLEGQSEAQQAFFNYCKQWKLAPWAHTQLTRNGWDTMLPTVAADFAQAHARIQTENEQRNAEAHRFLSAFHQQGIEVAILKGNLFAHTIYQDTGYKRMNDFDILIHARDWPAAQQVYADLNYIPLGFGWSGEKQKPAKFSHTGIPFISPNFHCIIGPQWGLKSATTRYRVDIDEAWATSLPFDFMGVPVRQLSPAYNLLHLVLHMGIYKCGIRDCMDVHNLLLSTPELDAGALEALFKKSNATEKAVFTLEMTQRCSDAVPPEMLNALQPNPHTFVMQRLEKRLAAVEKAGDIHVSYNDYFQDVEKNVIYFNLFQKFHQKAVFYGKIIRMIFWPKREVALKLSDQAQHPSALQSIGARLRAPFLVFAIIAQEIGWPFTLLLFLKLLFDLLWSLPNYLSNKESYFKYLRKRGIDPADVQKAVKGIE